MKKRLPGMCVGEIWYVRESCSFGPNMVCALLSKIWYVRKSRSFGRNMVCVQITLFRAKYGMCANRALLDEIWYVGESRSFGWNIVCVRIMRFRAKYGMCANHALSGEISYRKSRMTRSENYYPTLGESLEQKWNFGDSRSRLPMHDIMPDIMLDWSKSE